jgi:hypothetical protein
MHIHHLLVIDPPVWLIKAVDKLRRGFLWNNGELATGGRCLVRWDTICRPLEFGGLGISNLQFHATALRVRWLTGKALIDLPIEIDKRARELFNKAVDFRLGDRQRLNFWKDPWLDGQSIKAIAPTLFNFLTKHNLTVAQALTNGKWLRHFKRNMNNEALTQFLTIHDMVLEVRLRHGVPDSATWRWTADGKYSASSAYSSQSEGRGNFRNLIWSSAAPLKCKVFTWLAILGKCHTADCLIKKNWPHNAA